MQTSYYFALAPKGCSLTSQKLNSVHIYCTCELKYQGGKYYLFVYIFIQKLMSSKSRNVPKNLEHTAFEASSASASYFFLHNFITPLFWNNIVTRIITVISLFLCFLLHAFILVLNVFWYSFCLFLNIFLFQCATDCKVQYIT